jgi:DNA-binding SARP family transcriptional activator
MLAPRLARPCPLERSALDIAPLVLHLHGQARLAPANGPCVPLAGRAAALLALVALERRVARERAATLLWPDAERARENLRQALLRLRKQVPLSLLIGEAHLELAPDVQLAEAVPGDVLLADERAGEDAFGLWLSAARERERQAWLATLAARTAQAESAGDLAAALQFAQARSAADPLSEAALAELMRLHHLRGEPAAGLAVFQALQAMLASHYDAPPSPATLALAQTLRRGAADGHGRAAVAALPPALQRPPRLQGRARELQAARRAWEQGHAVLLEGAAGMGKTRLAAALCAASPLPPRWAAGRPGDASVPFAVLRRLLQAHGGQAMLALLAQPAPADGPASRTPALQHALAAWLALAPEVPLVLDDLHFADPASIELLAAAAAAELGAGPTRRWLFAQRPGETEPAAQGPLRGLVERAQLVVVPLAPLDERATMALLDDIALPGIEPPRLAAALLQHTGGNPLFLLETLKEGLLDGSLARGALPRPAAVHTMIEARLQRLPEPALALARVAAVAGVDFSLPLAEAVLAQAVAALATPWAELERAQLLRDEALAHDLVADALLRGLPRAVARHLHARCAAWLGGQAAEPARVAVHWQEGGEPRRAALAWRAAAERSERAGLVLEQGVQLAAAAACHTTAGERQEAFECRLERTQILGHTDFDAGLLAEAAALVAEADSELDQVRAACSEVALLSYRGDPEPVVAKGLAALALARRIGAVGPTVTLASPLQTHLLRLGRGAEIADVLLPMREWVDTHGTPFQAINYYGALGTWQAHEGWVREGNATREHALAIARAHGMKVAEARVLAALTVGRNMLGRADLAEATAREVLALSPADTGGNSQRAVHQLLHARQLVECGLFDEALAHLEAIEPLFVAQQVGFWLEGTRMLKAQLWLRLGQAARARALLLASVGPRQPMMRGQRVMRLLELGPGPGLPASDELRAEARSLFPSDSVFAHMLEVAALRVGTPEEVCAAAPLLARDMAARDRFGLQLKALAWWASAAAATGRMADVRTALAQSWQLLDEGYGPEALSRNEQMLLLARAALAVGDAGLARRALQAGVDWLQRSLPRVPPPFADSFLQRQPVNLALRALAQAQGVAPGAPP